MTGRRLVIDSSEDSHSEICYNTVSLEDIESRIQMYERRYGSYSQFLATTAAVAPMTKRRLFRWIGNV